MPNKKVLKTIQIRWKWHGDLYLLKGFNICLMPAGYNPVDNPDSIITLNQVLPDVEIINDEYIFSYNFFNQPLDAGVTCVPWIQALYNNSDSKWASMKGQVIDDDGKATIVVVGNPTFQQVIDMADDDKITPQEKLQLQKEWEEIVAEHQRIEIGVVKAGILDTEEVTEYVNTLQALAQYLNYNLVYDFTTITNDNFTYPTMLVDQLTTDLKQGHYKGKDHYTTMWRNYYEARIHILEKIRDQLFENNKNEIDNWFGQNTLPPTIPSGGYISGKLTANMDAGLNPTMGYIKVHYGTFITPTGIKFSIEGDKHIPTTLAGKDGGVIYLIFVGADSSRFSFTSQDDSQQFVCAIHNREEWFYLYNGEALPFKPNTEDCVIAKVEEFSANDEESGIKVIKLFASHGESLFDALTDGGKSQGVYRDEETGLIFINAEFMKIGVIKAQNGRSEFDLNDGTFRLGGTAANNFEDHNLKFDGNELSINANKINIGVHSVATDVDVEQAVDGLQIKVSESGGYNLLRNSLFRDNDIEEWWFWGNASIYWNKSYFSETGDMWWGIPEDSPGGLWQSYLEFEPNTEYTLSVKAGWESNVRAAKFIIEYRPNADCSGENVAYQEWLLQNDGSKRQVIKFTTPPNIRYAMVGFKHEGSVGGGNSYLIKINKPCIMKGIGSVWSPNPVESDDKIAKLQVTASEIRSEVSETKKGLESSITQTAKAIRAEVKDTADGLASSITQTAKAIRGEITDTASGLQSQITWQAGEISSKVSNSTFESYTSQTANLISSKVSSGDLGTLVQQSAEHWGLSIWGKLYGTNYSFNGENFSIGTTNGNDRAYHAATYSRWNHHDGSYTQVSSSGLEHYTNGERQPYHYMFDIVVVDASHKCNGTWFRVQLPHRFRGKNFTLAWQMGNGSVSENRVWSGHQVDVRNIDRYNATCEVSVTIYSKGKFSGGMSADAGAYGWAKLFIIY